MRILMLLTKTYQHDPRVSREAEVLRDAGHDVVVLEWARHDPDLPEHEEVDGVHVVRTNGGAAMRTVPFEVARAPLWWRHGAKLAAGLHASQPFDVVHAHDLDTLGVAVRFARRAGRHGRRPGVVFDAHERFDQMITGNVPWPVPAGARRLERHWLREVDVVVTASDNFAEHYQQWTDAPVHVVWNAFGAAPETYKPTTNDTFTANYIGTLSRDRMFPQLVDALGGVDGLHFVVGGKREGVFDDTEAAAACYDNVRFLGPVPHSDVLRTTCQADVVLAPLDARNPQYRVQVPNKLFDAMCCGRPLVTTQGTEAGRFVLEHDVGVVASYDPSSMLEAVLALRDDPEGCRRMADNGQVLARERFHWEPQARNLLAAYDDVLDRT